MAGAKQDYYDMLGIDKSAGDDEIKKAYRKIAKECHPDLHPGDEKKAQRFKDANEAYEILSDSKKKAMYDQYGHAGVDPSYQSGGGGGGGFGGFEDMDLGSIFESFFGGFGGGGGRNPNAPRKGDSLRANLVLTFEEAAFGAEKDIELSRIEHCSSCKGSGAAAGTSAETCKTCGGSGQVRSTQRTPMGLFSTTGACQSCNGQGKVIQTPCSACKGGGMSRNRVIITVKIPGGIDEGQAVPLRGQGNAGQNGGPSGDVLVSVSIRPHPLFVRERTTVRCDVPLTFTQAALGCELDVPTLDGKVRYTIPEGTQPGTEFRIRGKGIPNLGGKARGDQIFKVVVEVPKGLSKKQREALQAFGEACDEKTHPKSKSFWDKFKN